MYIQVCLAKPDSDRPETTIDRAFFRKPPPIVVFVHYIPEFPVIRYSIHRTIYGWNPTYRGQLEGNILSYSTIIYDNHEVRTLDLRNKQLPRVHLEKGSGGDSCVEHSVRYINTPDIEMAHKHATLSPMFIICYLFLFFVKFSVISYFFSCFFPFFFFFFFFLNFLISRFRLPESTIHRTLFRRPSSPV